jgi:hypothetical protein
MAGEWQTVQLIWYFRAKAGMACKFVKGLKVNVNVNINNKINTREGDWRKGLEVFMGA